MLIDLVYRNRANGQLSRTDLAPEAVPVQAGAAGNRYAGKINRFTGFSSSRKSSCSSQAANRRDQEERRFRQPEGQFAGCGAKDADLMRQTLMDQARKESDDLRAKQSESLDQERIETSREIVRLTCKEVFSVARKALSDLSSTSLESRMAEVWSIGSAHSARSIGKTFKFRCRIFHNRSLSRAHSICRQPTKHYWSRCQ